MALAESLPLTPSASVAATGLGIRYIGRDPQHVYAYSGRIIINDETATSLEFLAQAGYINGFFQFNFDAGAIAANNLIGFSIHFNDILTIESVIHTSDERNQPGLSATRLVIPPFTKCEFKAYTNYGTNIGTFSSLTGRVYGVA